MADLINSTQALAAIPAGVQAANTALTEAMPSIVSACSQAIERYCHRIFASTTYDEILTPAPYRPDMGETPVLKLKGFPVISVSRVSTGRITALTISNTDTNTNQIARASFVTSGTTDPGYSYTGITLTRMASGSPSTNTLTWASNTTVNALTTAVNALGGGWAATPTASTYGLWPTTELLGPDGVSGAFSPGVPLDIFATDITNPQIDYTSGQIAITTWFGQSVFAGSPFAGAVWDDFRDNLGTPFGGQYRVGYNAGFLSIPDPIQQACVLMCKDVAFGGYDQAAMGVYDSERIGDYSYTLAKGVQGMMSPQVLSLITPYRDWKP